MLDEFGPKRVIDTPITEHGFAGIGVGAAFKFHSGEVTQAPRWMMKYSLEWLFRLYQEPNRLWSRYLLTNGAFVILFLYQLLKQALHTFTQRFIPADTLVDELSLLSLRGHVFR